MQPSLNQHGAGNTTNGQLKPYELSTTQVLPEYVDPSMCYMPNGYFYGGNLNIYFFALTSESKFALFNLNYLMQHMMVRIGMIMQKCCVPKELICNR